MTIGQRVRRLLDKQGHSYLEAATLSGVSHETIRRIVMGHTPPKLRLYVGRIAQAYQVDELALLEGESPKSEFEWIIMNAPLAQRLEWMLMMPSQRVKLALDFLSMHYPKVVTHRILASAVRLPCSELLEMLQGWDNHPPDRVVATELAHTVHNLTGISLEWLNTGRLREGLPPTSYLARFTTLAKAKVPSGWVSDIQGMIC